jgi:D-alanyl-D-alanine carboxypeptidase
MGLADLCAGICVPGGWPHIGIMKRTLHLAALLALLAGTARAEPTAAELAAELLSASGAPGVVVAIDRAGQRDIGVAGIRSLGAAEPVEAGDLWHLGSNTKSMTATLVARLAEAGVISWDDTVGAVLGPWTADMDAAYEDVTYADLLAHQAGVGANAGLMMTLALSGTDRDLSADRLRYAAAVLTAAPGPEGFAYSNAGYVIAGAMMEATTRQAWEDLIRAEVFMPLGLDSAGFGAPGMAGVMDQPRGHKAGWLGLKAMEPGPLADNIAALGPAGTVHMAADDVLDYLQAHLRQDDGFLTAESWTRLHMPTAGQDYVAGWNVRADGTLTHAGSNTMWFAQFYVVPAQNTVMFISGNSGDLLAQRPAFLATAERVLGPLPD